jgi:magnesium transporter
MKKYTSELAAGAGLSPGTLLPPSQQPEAALEVQVLVYDQEGVLIMDGQHIDQLLPLKEQAVTWIHVQGRPPISMLEQFGRHFNLHPLLLEDLLQPQQRPKAEDYGDYIFVSLKALRLDIAEESIQAEQVGLILGERFVLSFLIGSTGRLFDPVAERIKSGKGRIRRMGPDYLAYSQMDLVVDRYFLILEKLGEEIEDLEEELVTSPTSQTMHRIHALKREMIALRRSVWPLREVISGLERGESPLIHPKTIPYFRDLYDHVVQVMDTIESFREMLSGMVDIYLSSVSNKMNQIMKLLTIIATIFIPLTFIVGIYGMNFEYMPELKWRWGYFGVMALMTLLAVGMLVFFRLRKWF